MECNCPHCGYANIDSALGFMDGESQVMEILCDDCEEFFEVRVTCEHIYECEVIE